MAELFFLGASETVYAVDTEHSVSIPPAVEPGDLLIAVIMHRYTLTPPDGWTLIESDGIQPSGESYFHSLSVFARTAEEGDAGALTTWQQASSQRITAHIVALRGATVHASDILTTTVSTSVFDTPTLPKDKENLAAIAIGTVVTLPSGNVTVSPDPGWTLTTPSSAPDNRLAVAINTALRDPVVTRISFNTSLSNSVVSALVLIEISNPFGVSFPPSPIARDYHELPPEHWEQHHSRKFDELPRSHDQYFGGRGRITGTVTVNNVPAARRVLAIDRRTNLVVAETWSAADGSYTIDWLDERRQYVLLSYDHTGEFNAVVADNVTPEPMP